MAQLNRLLDRYEQLGKRYIVGLDLGQTVDSSAIAVLEQHNTSKNAGNVDEPLKIDKRWEVRHLERLPLGTPYPAQVAYVAELLSREPLASQPTSLVIDQSGVGRPVFDMFKKARLKPVGVTITGGETVTDAGEGSWRVAKLHLISGLQAALHSGDLKIAASLKDAKALMHELREFRATFSTVGNVLFSAREGAHDDLILSLAIALWWGMGSGRTVQTVAAPWLARC